MSKRLLILERFCYSENGTFGKFIDAEGRFLCYTVERPWNDNVPGVSCIPEGTYKATPFDSPHHGETFILENPDLHVYKFEADKEQETDRCLCLLAHVGNYATSVQGCVGVGRYLSANGSTWMVTESSKTMEALREWWTGVTEFEVEIRQVRGAVL